MRYCGFPSSGTFSHNTVWLELHEGFDGLVGFEAMPLLVCPGLLVEGLRFFRQGLNFKETVRLPWRIISHVFIFSLEQIILHSPPSRFANFVIGEVASEKVVLHFTLNQASFHVVDVGFSSTSHPWMTSGRISMKSLFIIFTLGCGGSFGLHLSSHGPSHAERPSPPIAASHHRHHQSSPAPHASCSSSCSSSPSRASSFGGRGEARSLDPPVLDDRASARSRMGPRLAWDDLLPECHACGSECPACRCSFMTRVRALQIRTYSSRCLTQNAAMDSPRLLRRTLK